MLVTMTAMLVSVADLTSFLSVLVVTVCFLGMFLYVTRNMRVFWLHGEEFMFGTSVHHLPPRITQMKMMKVHIPFTFKLQETTKSSYKDLQYSVSSQVSYSLQAFWGVSIRELHVFLWRQWSVNEDTSCYDSVFQGPYQLPGPCIRDGPHGERQMTMTLPTSALDLGTPPRLCYPLVIFLVRDDPGSLHPDEAVALINVVHIKDSVCTLPTSVLAQYLKQANGTLSCLKQLYLASGNPLTYEDEERPVPVDDTCSMWSSAGEQLCVVCQYYPLSRALLPCRHTCVCACCFPKLESCPMCRSPIDNYFCIRSEEYVPEIDLLTSPSKPEPFTQWIQDRLTDFLGFH